MARPGCSPKRTATTRPELRLPELGLVGPFGLRNNVGTRIAERNLNVQPTIEIRPGQRFNVFVNKDLILKPYKRS